jgi:hypothetical protein
MTCFTYYHGRTRPTSFYFDMFSRNTSNVGVKAHGLSIDFFGMYCSCGIYFYLCFIFYNVLEISFTDATFTLIPSATSKGMFAYPRAKIEPTLVASSLSSTWVPVLTFTLLVMAFIISFIVFRLLPVYICSLSTLSNKVDRPLIEAFISFEMSSSIFYFLSYNVVRYSITWDISDWRIL